MTDPFARLSLVSLDALRFEEIPRELRDEFTRLIQRIDFLEASRSANKSMRHAKNSNVPSIAAFHYSSSDCFSAFLAKPSIIIDSVSSSRGPSVD
jgi:hypothetical protein